MDDCEDPSDSQIEAGFLQGWHEVMSGQTRPARDVLKEIYDGIETTSATSQHIDSGLNKSLMDIQSLTAAMHTFVESKGWYDPASPKPQTPKNLAVSLVLEASEVLEHFQWGEETVDKAELASELADVMLYLLQLASISEIDLGQAVLDKLETNYGRTWE